ncbi:MAG: antibiotic biosynthesis monooxygenase [Devosia nanyangense]|uniref:Antibiotic biosynthesis monooxygenase n=1 Tax=Devosia nanyangense TaxID=1228055 RepID=A0A933L2S5_9HYPH|nr:antibiotic biosynthesis monooxygenase [Devosia nanyangense]
MTAYNSVRFRVKPGKDQAFIDSQRRTMAQPMKGFLGGGLIKTGDRTYCFIGQWKSFDDIVAARPAMIAILDDARPLLEDLGDGLGVTDPVSGSTVVEVPASP